MAKATTKKPGGRFTKTERRNLKTTLGKISKGKLSREEIKRGVAALPHHVEALQSLREPKRRIARAQRSVRAYKVLLRVGKFKK